MCHNPGTVDPDSGESLDMAYMAHSIHTGENRADTSTTPATPKPYVIYGFGGSATSFADVTYPQSTLFCETCHTQSAAAPNGDDWKVKSGASQCGGCHITGLRKTPDANTGLFTYQYAHKTFAWTGNDGECEQCHITGGAAGATLDNHVSGPRLAKSLGEQFKFQILAVTNVGLNKIPTIKFKISKPDGTPYNINTDKAFTTSGASLNLYLGWDTKDISNALPDGSTPGLNSAGAANTRGYPFRMQIAQIKAAATTAGQPAADGTYTIPFFAALPVDTTNVMVVMDGHPKGLPPGVTDWTKSVNAAAHNAVFYSGTPRVRLVAEVNCNKCHELLSLHGANRNGDPQGCLVCHNSSGGYSDSANIGGPIAMGAFIHNLHMGKVTAVGAITYPQSLANCQACHLAGSYYTARVDALPISTGPGANLSNVFDDTWDSASAGTCGACHDGDAAKSHMTQQGGSFGNVGGKTLTPSVAQESCSVCHGAGRIADTAVIHAAQ
jgi:OmcA/MtrC family decaheme c-type cytochrome